MHLTETGANVVRGTEEQLKFFCWSPTPLKLPEPDTGRIFQLAISTGDVGKGRSPVATFAECEDSSLAVALPHYRIALPQFFSS